jgi:DNA-binding response OmpR family regulator/putative methionine-R-sulfoxide reductase with GAF domain
MAEPNARILVCDDEKFFREAIRDILTGEQLEVLEAEDGESALELATDPGIGVLVLDIRLPGIDGLEVLKRLSADRPDLRVIMLSANSDQELVLEALRLGACDYLAKPLHDEELVLAVRRAAESHALAEGWGRLRVRVERLAAELEALSERAVEAGSDERDAVVAQGLVQLTAELLEAGRTSLLRLVAEGDALEVAALHGQPAGRAGSAEFDRIAPGEGVAGAVFELGEAVLVEDIVEDARFAEFARAEGYASRSFAIAPLLGGGQLRGLLCAADRPGGARFGEEDAVLLRLLAAHAVELLREGAGPVAADAAADPSEPLDGDAELARAICDAITNEVEPEQLYQAALRPVEKQLAAAPVSLYLIDAEHGTLRCEASRDGGEREDRPELPVGVGLSGTVMQTGRMVATDEPELDSRFEAAVDTPLDGEVGPIVCAPLLLRGKVVGVFRAFPRDGAETSARAAEVVAAALSAAVRNALLYRSLLESIDEVAEVRRSARG